MTDYPTPPIAGYPQYTDEMVSLVNRNKEIEERLLRLCDELKSHTHDPQWRQIAVIHFQEGFMALNRAIFQPLRLRLPEDPPATT